MAKPVTYIGKTQGNGPMPAKDEVTIRQIDLSKTVELCCDSPTMKGFSVWVKKKNLTKAKELYKAQGYTVHVIK